jgi:hypothetical protein
VLLLFPWVGLVCGRWPKAAAIGAGRYGGT